MKRFLWVGLALGIWLLVVAGTLPGYLHTEVFYINIYDPDAFWDRLRELCLVLAITVPAAVILGYTTPRIPPLNVKNRQINRIALCFSVVATGGLVLYAQVLWEAIPRIPDSIAYLFQAKIFAAGRLWAPVPDPFHPFDYMFTFVSEHRYLSRYSPGFPLLLAAGILCHLPWIVPPLFGGLSVWLTYRLYNRLFQNHLQALLVIVLMVTSPYFLGVSCQVLSHTTALFFYLIFLHAGLSAMRSNRVLPGLLAGGALGYFFLTRQLTAVALGGPFLVYFGFQQIRRRLWRPFWAMVVAGMVMLGIQLVYNWDFTGHPLQFPFHEGEFGALDRLGFNHQVKWDVWPEPGESSPYHTPARALKNIHLCFSRINRSLYGWPSSLFFVPLALFWITPRSIWDRMAAISILVMAAAYSLYWFPGAGLLGARYYFEALPAFIFLTVRGCAGLHRALSIHWYGRLKWFPALFIIVSSVHGAVYFWPKHIELSWDAFAQPLGKVFGWMENDLKTPALVFITGDTTSFSFGFFKNDIFLDNPVIYARDLGPEKNRIVSDQYPDRTPYLFHFDSRDHHLLPLNQSCRINRETLSLFQSETCCGDSSRATDTSLWTREGRSRDTISVDSEQVFVKGTMHRDMAPGSFAHLRYLDIPVSDCDISVSFRAPVCDHIVVALSLDNGRYLDEFKTLASVMVAYVGRTDQQNPCYLFNWKGLGYRWNPKTLPSFGNEDRVFHRLTLKVESDKSQVSAFIDDIPLGSQIVPFRSSILKIRLSVSHDGIRERPVNVEWDSFRLVYSGKQERGLPVQLSEPVFQGGV
jgi:Dolichyl-phosphate-mannose-protein mannosyltransferase